MEGNAPEVYEAILKADRESQQLFSGHGSALAQAYNHIIMPLADRQDKYTQVLWGIRDFRYRFGREPEGMWLPETAVDLETLDILARLGLKFTILAPHQAARVRRLGTRDWEDVSGGRIDPTRAYRVKLSSGRTFSLFFYDGPISRAVAFEGLLANGENYANRLLSAFSDQRDWPQLVNIATDGESYGHHHGFGDMTLAYALRHIESNLLAKITNYGEYLERHPAKYEVEIIENTSWSCVHGIARWRSDCGCNSGQHPGWNQSWRAPLRQALDWLHDTLAPAYEKNAARLLKDPWAARNDYIGVLLDRSAPSVRSFFTRHARHRLDKKETIQALKLLELQRHAMLMYTSCGWFFDELSGLETVQVIQYAGRVVQLARELFGDDVEEKFLQLLEAAKSNIPEFSDGYRVYERFFRPAMIDLTKVAAHYAISSLFEDYDKKAKIFCYQINTQDYHKVDCGKARQAVGRARVTSEVTRESEVMSYGVLHFGDHNVNAGVRSYRGGEAYNDMVAEMTQTCTSADFPGVIRLMDKHFGISNYSLKSLFRDEQRKILGSILEATLADVESEYRKIYQSNYPLMRFLTDIGNPLPGAFRSAAELILNIDLRQALETDVPDEEAINKLLSDARMWKISLDVVGLGHVFRQTIAQKMVDLSAQPENGQLLEQVLALVSLGRSLPFTVDLREAQNIYYQILKTVYPGFQNKAGGEDQAAEDWIARFVELGDRLSIQVS
jgi:hypothetical protein